MVDPLPESVEPHCSRGLSVPVPRTDHGDFMLLLIGCQGRHFYSETVHGDSCGGFVETINGNSESRETKKEGETRRQQHRLLAVGLAS